MDIFDTPTLAFPRSLPEFQKLFPDDAACAIYLEKIRWPQGFACPSCSEAGDPARISTRPTVLRCRKCRAEARLTAGTVIQDSHTPLSTWFWGAYLLTSLIPGMSAVQFQRQLGLKRYETAFQILHKLRSGMVRHDRDRIGTKTIPVEVDETYIGGRTRGEGKGTHHKTLVAAAVEIRTRKPKEKDIFGEQSKAIPRRGGRYAGRLRLSAGSARTAKQLTGFVQRSVEPGTMVVTDDWAGYDGLGGLGYEHLQVAERGDPKVDEEYLPLVHLIFSNLKTWLLGVHHGVSAQHLQAYLNEFTFRFNRRFYPFNAFRSLLGIGAGSESPTYEELYSVNWEHPNPTGSTSHGV
jgi:transposase-like protein